MIRQLCPNCYASVELPPEAAGRDAPCPKCGKAIAVPAAYAPSVAPAGGLPGLTPSAPPETGRTPMTEPTAPPGLNPAAVAPPPLAPMPTTPAPANDSCGHHCSVALNPVWLDWVPVACLTVVLALTLFSWVGTYPGGVRVYSQNPWYAAIGWINTNTLPEDLLGDEKYFDEKVTTNYWLLGYFPLLFVAIFLGWLDRFIRTPNVNTMPVLGAILKIWPQRFLVLTILSGALLALLLIQTWRGYGLETAVKQKVAERYAEQIEKADSTPKKQNVSVKMGEDLAKYQLMGTTPLNFAIALHAIAFTAMLGRWWLHNRGAKPHPRISLQY